MRKKIFALLLCLLLTAALPLNALAANHSKRLAISSTEELLQFAENCRLDSYSRELEVVLTADLDLSGTDFQGIPIFSGTFDGGGHKITGLNITADGSVMGFFRYLTEDARMENLHLSGNVLPQGSKNTIGALAGSNAGKISGCSFSGQVSGNDNIGGLVGVNLVSGIVENSAAAGSVDGNHFVGGLVGANYGVIRNSVNEADINTTPQQNQVSISDITLETLIGSENAATVTDIGGIAGNSSGVIRNSKNRGDVGYKHMGYNIGGIAGSQSGLITGCDNYGAVSGRKEVGGIVGHLEPGIRMDFSEDTLQTLKSQMDTMGELAGNAASAAQGGAAAISGQVGALRGHAQNAQDALDQLTPTVSRPEGELLPDITLPDADTIKAAQNTLSGSLSGMKGSMEGLMSATQSAAGAISGSIDALSRHMETVSQTINNASEGLGGTFTDVSDEDTGEDTTGKISYCDNHGAVLADLNAGGVAGAMALETDLDPEADISINGSTSLNFDGMLRAVILGCTNSASVNGKKQNAGGITGWMDLGLVKSCINTGSVEGSDYVGGIAGRSNGFIRKSSAKCALTGDSYVGGIGGLAETVTDCRSMVVLNAREKLGAVTGSLPEETEISGNFYLAVENDPGAIDGISYEGAAQGLDRETFLALEGLSKIFQTVTVTFRFADGTTETVQLPQGDTLQMENIPQIPERTGYTGSWEGLDNLDLVFDTMFQAVYTPYSTVIESSTLRPNGKPVLLAEGSFPPEADITVSHSVELPEESENLLWWNDTITVTASEEVSQAKILEVLSITVPEDCGQVVYRYLPPEGTEDTAMLLVRQSDGRWKHIESVRRGSYLVFDSAGSETLIALVEAREPLPWWIFAAGAALIIGAVTAVCVIAKRKASK